MAQTFSASSRSLSTAEADPPQDRQSGELNLAKKAIVKRPPRVTLPMRAWDSLALAAPIWPGCVTYCICLTTREFQTITGQKPKFTDPDEQSWTFRRVKCANVPGHEQDKLLYMTRDTFAVCDRDDFIDERIRKINLAITEKRKWQRKHCIVLCTITFAEYYKPGPDWEARIAKVRELLSDVLQRMGQSPSKQERTRLLFELIAGCALYADPLDRCHDPQYE